MRYTVQYVPLSKIKPALPVPLTQRMKELRKAAQDCMHLIIVRKSRKEGGYIIVSGHNQLEYLLKHTRKKTAACLVDQNRASARISSFIQHLGKRNLPYEVPHLKQDRTPLSSWSIIRRFLKQEPRFRNLSRTQQLKVLRLGLQYKRTTIMSMKAKVDEFQRKRSV